jgi:two-component system OmpR family response regulator
MRILLVEDDDRTAQFVKKGFSQAGYAVDRAADGME